MASSQECEIDGDPRRTGVVATGVETIIDIVKSDADGIVSEEGYQMPRPVEHARGDSRDNHHRDNPAYSAVLNG
jgi:hypothetical protein